MRSNCDASIIVTASSLFFYLNKYVTKCEDWNTSLDDIAGKVQSIDEKKDDDDDQLQQEFIANLQDL